MRAQGSILLAGSCSVLLLLACTKNATGPAPKYPNSQNASAIEPIAPGEQAAPLSTDNAGSVAAATPDAAQDVPPSPALTGGALNDGQIAKITQTANLGEIEQAEIAKQKAKSAKVKAFALKMLKDHTQANQQGSQLAKQANLMPEESAVSQELSGEAARVLESLKSADASAFDQRYIDSQIKQHQRVLSLLDGQLIPQATDPKLKAQLQKARTMVEHHLGQAQQIAGGV